MRYKGNGYLLHRGKVNGQTYLVLAVGTNKPSTNTKTGKMIQISIILEETHPWAAVEGKMDGETICRGCPLSGGNGCYVEVNKSITSIWHAYHRGNYPKLEAEEYARVFARRTVRFGAYGNPSLIPLTIIKRIAELADGWTGYFHDWMQMGPAKAKRYNKYFMASTEHGLSYDIAKAWGLRVFHASNIKPETAIECLNSTRKIKCEDCLLCAGTSKPARDIWITPHGKSKRKVI